jgi:hypothetical protein
MAVWTEYKDCFEVEIHRRGLVGITEVSTDQGLSFCFGQKPKRSYRYKLISVSFDKNYWTFEDAPSWWRTFDVRFVHKKRLGTKLPEVFFWLDEVNGVYTFVCYRGTKKTHPASFWLKEGEPRLPTDIEFPLSEELVDDLSCIALEWEINRGGVPFFGNVQDPTAKLRPGKNPQSLFLSLLSPPGEWKEFGEIELPSEIASEATRHIIEEGLPFSIVILEEEDGRLSPYISLADSEEELEEEMKLARVNRLLKKFPNALWFARALRNGQIAPEHPAHAYGMVMEPVDVLYEAIDALRKRLAEEWRDMAELPSLEDLDAEFQRLFQKLLDSGECILRDRVEPMIPKEWWLRMQWLYVLDLAERDPRKEVRYVI